MKKIIKQDFVGESKTNLEEAIEKAISQGKIEAEAYKVIEMVGSQLNNKKSYQVVLSERED